MSGLASILFIASVSLLGLAFGGAYQRIITGDLVVVFVVAGVALGLLAFVFGLAALVFRPRGKRGQGEVGIVVFLAVLFGLSLIGGGAYLYITFAQKFPFINDVTTDVTNPPEFRGTYTAFSADEGQSYVTSRTARVYDPSFADLQTAGYPNIKPKLFSHAPDVVFRAAIITTTNMKDWKITHSEPEKFHMELEVETEMLHFVDDIVIEVRPTPTGSELHMRSKSRTGRFDFGMNAERIRSFMDRIDGSVEKILANDKSKAAAANIVSPESAPPQAPPAAGPK